MLKINMFSKAGTVKGHGVLAAYDDLIALLKRKFTGQLTVRINEFSSSDISHYHTIHFRYYLSTFLPKKRGIKVCHVHFLPDTLKGSLRIPSLFDGVVSWYITSFYKRMDQLVVVNPIFKKELIALGLDEEKINYIPNFVSKNQFFEKNSEEKEAVRSALNIDKDAFVIVGVGQIQKRKGIDDFIALAERNPSIQFIWLGGFSFGRITDGYEKYKKIYENPPANVIFTGIIDREKIVDYYNAANIFLLPSYNELFPMSILEAFSCGVPVLVRDLDLYEEIIDGYYESFTDLDDLDKKVKAFQMTPSMLNQAAENSRKAAITFSEDHVGEQWLSFYTSLVEQEDLIEQTKNK